MSRNCYVFLDKKIVFFFSFKSGNTSLVSWLYEYIKPRNEAGLRIMNKRSFMTSSNISIPLKLGEELVLVNKFTGIALCRNPVDRIISAFVNKFIVDGDKWIYGPSNLEPFARIHLGDKVDRGISFIEFLEEIAFLRKNKKNIRINQHFDTQIPDSLLNKNLYNRILRLEQVDVELNQLCNDFGIECKAFPRLRGTTAVDGKILNEDLSSVNSYELSSQHIRPTHKNFLNARTSILINEIYKNDFLVFNYKFLT